MSDIYRPLNGAIDVANRLATILESRLFSPFDFTSSEDENDNSVSGRNSSEKRYAQEEVIDCVLKMRTLLEEAEKESRRLLVEGTSLRESFGSSLSSVNADVVKIRQQLNEQGSRISQINDQYASEGECVKCKQNISCSASAVDVETPTSATDANFSSMSKGEIDEFIESSKKETLAMYISSLLERNSELSKENEVLSEEVYLTLRNGGTSNPPCVDCSNLQIRIGHLESEKRKMRDAFFTLRKERKSLKTEKMDLLEQLKGLYNTLELKENELRDFIMNYGIRVKESESMMKAANCEKERLRKEQRDAVRREKEQTEKCKNLTSQLNTLQEILLQRNEELDFSRKELSHLADIIKSNKQKSARNSVCSHETPLSSRHTHPSDEMEDRDENFNQAEIQQSEIDGSGENLPTSVEIARTSPDGSCSEVKDMRAALKKLELDCAAPMLDLSRDLILDLRSEANTAKSAHSSASSNSGSDSQYLSLANPDCLHAFAELSNRGEQVPETPTELSPGGKISFHHEETPVFLRSGASTPTSPTKSNSMKRRTLSKTFSKLFGRDKRSSGAVSPTIPAIEDMWELPEGEIQNKWQLWDSIRTVPMSLWKAHDVLIWLELDCSMPMYLTKCYENIKSGSLLLAMTDTELASTLGITNPMHKMKLRLAVEEHRDPYRRIPHMLKLDHVWVAYTWLRDLGMSQYAAAFEKNLIDGRMLSQLSKKDLEKHLGMNKKHHQASFFRGVDLLKILNFDKEQLYLRRSNCIDQDIDVLVWSNERVAKWIESIDLKEYSTNLTESGIHGALMVLDTNFNADTMAHALNLPASKQHLQNHLALKLSELLNKGRKCVSPSLLMKYSKTKKLSRSLSFKTPREPSQKFGYHSFRIRRKCMSAYSTGSLPATSRHKADASRRALAKTMSSPTRSMEAP